MTLSPTVISLLAASSLTAAMTLAAALLGVVILRGWDPASGSELQLRLERHTYLVSTILGVVLFFRIPALFLFIAFADSMSGSIVGAMCAFGSFHVNSHGFPALLLNVLFALMSGVWLIINRLDAQGYDYPLIRVKYRFLLIMAPLAVAGAVEEFRFFGNIAPDVITSCCGSLFSQRPGVEISDIFVLPVPPLYTLVLLVGGAIVVSPLLQGRWGYAPLLQGGASIISFPLSIVFVIAAVSPYVYELPTHHCPFCILKQEYHFVGHLLYGTLLISTVSGIGAGISWYWRKVPSLSQVIPRFSRRISIVSSLCHLIFLVVSTLCITLSNLRT